MKKKLPLRFGRNEFAGAFGDLGTDIPLIVLLILVCKLDAGSVMVAFGVCQVFAGFAYRLPIPVQPLKAMAAIAIADNLSGRVLAGGGLAVGLIMLVLVLSGGLALVERIIPKQVIRGLQFGLGIKLALLGLNRCLLDQTVPGEGYALGTAAFVIILLLRHNRKCPAAPVVLAVGLLYTAYLYLLGFHDGPIGGFDLGVPTFQTPSLDAIWVGLLVLAIPQLPLSLGNAVLATKQTVSDLFPGRQVSVRKLGLTYSLCNLVAPLFGGIPVCHGSGGLAGHYAFGARTGGSAIIYGTTFLLCGLLFGNSSFILMSIFPKAILGMLLLFEAIALMQLSRDMAASSEDFFVVLVVGLLAAGVPYGFCIAMIVGTLLQAWMNRVKNMNKQTAPGAEQSESRLGAGEGNDG